MAGDPGEHSNESHGPNLLGQQGSSNGGSGHNARTSDSRTPVYPAWKCHLPPYVFIGSSSQMTFLVKSIVERLREKHIQARPWYEGVFQAGKYTLESLIEKRTISTLQFSFWDQTTSSIETARKSLSQEIT
jgi:hypothetical protein